MIILNLMQPFFHENGLDEVFEEFQEELEFFGSESCCLRLNRNNSDESVNNYGYKLIDFYKLNTLFILNGRTESDISPGAFTYKNTSCIDYFICSRNVLPVVKCLNIHYYCHLLSDAHNPVTLELNLSTFVANTIYQNSMAVVRVYGTPARQIYIRQTLISILLLKV